MTDDEYEQWKNGTFIEYAGFKIMPKRDFGETGFWDSHTRRHVKEGWVIVRAGCNIMPGATWAHTQAQATQMIDAFIVVDEDPQKFHHLMRAINAAAPEPDVRKKGEVRFTFGNPTVDREELDRYLEGVEGALEDSSSFARSCIYKEVIEHYGKEAWGENRGGGFMHTVGTVGDMPVCVSILTYTIKGHKILFVEPTSQVVDHRMVRDWIESVLPQSAWHEGRKQFRISDVNNWYNAIPN